LFLVISFALALIQGYYKCITTTLSSALVEKPLELEDSLPWSKEPSIGPYPEQDIQARGPL
jgi:hypothetical protein